MVAPDGWRLPGERDRVGEWANADRPYQIHGDFNGDGIADEASFLFGNARKAWALFVFLGQARGAPRAIKLVEENRGPAQRFVLETIRPSAHEFRTACGKQYFACAKGEPLTITFRLPSISLCVPGSSCSVFVWRSAAAQFQRVRMSD